MIKIVHIISNLSIGGAQILLFDILKNLKKQKDLDIYLITIDSGEYIDKYKNAGLKVIDLKEKGLLNPKIFFKLKSILQFIKPDIVHTHLNKADFYGRISAKLAGTKVIYSTCHNYSTTHTGADIKKKSVFDYVDNFVIKYTKSYLIAISGIVKEYLLNRNSEFEKITEIIYNGIDTGKAKNILNTEEKEKYRKIYYISKDDFVISVIGRLEKQKGQLFFLNSIKDFLLGNSNVKVLISGDGNLRKEIEKFIKINSITEQVKLTGFIKDAESIIEISDLIVVPSLWEGFGLVLAEAMIKKKIILASNVGGIPEVIEDKKSGFLFESENKNDLLNKLKDIYLNMNNLDIIKQTAFLRVVEKFDIQKNSELYYKSYLSNLNKFQKNVNKENELSQNE